MTPDAPRTEAGKRLLEWASGRSWRAIWHAARQAPANLRDAILAIEAEATPADSLDALRAALEAVEDIARHKHDDSAWHDVRVIVEAALR